MRVELEPHQWMMVAAACLHRADDLDRMAKAKGDPNGWRLEGGDAQQLADETRKLADRINARLAA